VDQGFLGGLALGDVLEDGGEVLRFRREDADSEVALQGHEKSLEHL
jgi:hypothetical protein